MIQVVTHSCRMRERVAQPFLERHLFLHSIVAFLKLALAIPFLARE